MIYNAKNFQTVFLRFEFVLTYYEQATHSVYVNGRKAMYF